MPASRWPWWWRHSLDAARAAAERASARHRADRGRSSISRRRWRKQAYVQAPSTILRGDPDAALKTAPHKLTAEFSVGGQEHFYLEGQIAFALPGEDGDLVVHSSTQHPTEVQHVCAQRAGLRLQPRDHGGAPPGRRLRRQGEQRLVGRGGRGARRRQDRQAGEAPPAARDRHHRDRQAPRLRLSLHGGLRRRGPRAGARRDAGGRCRLEPRHDAGRGGARAHPCRQRLLDPARPRRRLLLHAPTSSRTPPSAASAGRRACW